MSQTIASLVVSLEANVARFQADMARAVSITDLTMADIGRAARGAGAALGAVAAAGAAVGGAIVALANDSISAVAALDDLADKTGASVERLSALSEVAKIGGHDMTAIGDSIVKLAKSMVTSTDATSGAGRALATLGLSATDASGKLKNSGDFMVELAARLDDFGDGTGKTAVAVELLGRSGAAALPFLKDLAELGEVGAKVTKEQAAQADAYEKNLKRLRITADDMVRTVSMAMLPALNDTVRTMLNLQGQSGSLSDTLKQLAEDGSIARWTEQAALGIATLVDAFVGLTQAVAVVSEKLPGVMKSMTVNLAEYLAGTGQLSTGQPIQGIERMSRAFDGGKKAVADFGAQVIAAYKDTKAFDELFRTITDRKILEMMGGGATDGGKPQVSFREFTDGAQAAGDAAAKYRAEVERLLNTLENRGDAVSREFWQQLAMLHKEFDSGALSQERYVGAVTELIERTKFGADETRRYEEATKAAVKAELEHNAAQEKLRDAYLRTQQALTDMLDALQFEIDALTMTNAEREVAIRLRSLERAGIEKGTAAYEEAAARIRDLVESKEGLQSQISLWQDIERTAHDAFMDIAFNGTDAFKRIGQALKTWVLDALYQLAIKPIVVNIAAMMTGNPGIATALGGAAGGGGIGGGDILSLISGGSSLLGGASSIVGAELATFAGNTALAVGLGEMAGSFAALGSMIGTALPVLGVAIAIATMSGLFDKEPSQVRGEFGIQPGTAGFEDNAFVGSLFGNLGFLDEGTMYFSGAAAEMFDTLIADTLGALAERMSGDQISSLTARLQGMDFGAFEGEYTTQDFLQEYGGEILQQVISTAFDELNPALAAIMRGFEGTADEVANLANALLTFHDVSSQLPEVIRNQLTAALDDAAETIERVTALATAYATIQEVMNADPLEDALEAIRRATQGSYNAFLGQTEALNALIDNFDGSTAAAQELAQATADYYTAQVTLLAQLEQLKTTVNDMFAGTARGIQLSTLDRDGQLDFLAAETDRLLAQIAASTNPEEIARLSERLNQNLNQSFGLLTPEEQRRRAQEYLDYIEDANRIAQERITLMQENAAAEAEAAETRMRNMLDEFIGKLDKSGDKALVAGDLMLSAARNFPRTVVAVVRANELVP